MKKIRIIIVDDERPAREELKLALGAYADMDIVGEARNADDAHTQIEALRPDLIFLDIQMPGKSGFALLESLAYVPEVIFVTAYHDHAVQAFEVNALDYIVKPFREERLARALERVRSKILVAAPDRQLFIKDGTRCYFIRPGEISHIESVENYSRLYFQDKKVLLKRSLNQWEKLLDAEMFFRVSRTHLVNLNHIAGVLQRPGGRLRLRLISGIEADVSSRQSAKFKNLNDL